jgi:molecular chaperone GrpE
VSEENVQGTSVEGQDAVSVNAEALREERDRLKDQLLRTAADFDNFRKRTKKELEDSERRGREETVRELLPVFDNLERAVNAAQASTDLASIIEGVSMVLKMFEETVGRVGLTKVPTVGQRFDPAFHEAIQQKETDEQPPGTVLSEIVAGYRLGDRLVRPAMVVVARKPG